jgi:flagellar basal body-associated protein FliL
MNKLRFALLMSMLAVALLVVQPAVVALQEPATSNPSSASQQNDPEANPPSSMQSDQQTFTGKIAKSGGKYVLKDSTHKMTYSLDDQEKAKDFEGKSVKITGMLDTQTNIIRIAVIEPGM